MNASSYSGQSAMGLDMHIVKASSIATSKPDNIFLHKDGKTPVVGDFGICFISEEGERFTLTDEAVGARRFTAPELEDGRAAGYPLGLMCTHSGRFYTGSSRKGYSTEKSIGSRSGA